MPTNLRNVGISALCVGSLLGGQAVRKTRRAAVDAEKTIAGIPVLNYDRAYGGAAPSASSQEKWVIMGDYSSSDAELAQICEAAKDGCRLRGHPSNGGVPFVEVVGTESDLEVWLKGSVGIEFIEPDMPFSIIPELDEAEGQDASIESLWGLDRIGRSKRPGQGAGTNIYIFDTGIRTSHSDFGGRAAGAMDLSSGGKVECRPGDSTCAQDRQGHGTHCAGTAGGETYGVASAARIYSVKVLADDGAGDMSWSVTGLDYIGINGLRPAVASMSLGGSGRVQSIFRAVEMASNAGVTVVVAAGNSNADACDYSPAFATAAITVGSTTSNDMRSTFSNFGRCTDFWAPGSTITSAGHRSDTDSAISSGTSMACPHVSGAVALIMEQNPSIMSQQVLQSLYANAWKEGIRGLFPDDKNEFLYVGNDGPPDPPAPTPAPPRVCFGDSNGPDAYGDCVCNPGFECWWGDYGGCPYSSTESTGFYHRFYYLPSCEDCKCWPL